ncbi:hypothetical protein [uncultured Pyramidobacter sp.]|uniref:hypothetical protein n=1 Tax=uncultured Pyramidobacter sp. TaxID=1623495 RepID=UPI002805E73E|nr:hypothetical protein [uncultured Pyramidobacter sp.]
MKSACRLQESKKTPRRPHGQNGIAQKIFEEGTCGNLQNRGEGVERSLFSSIEKVDANFRLKKRSDREKCNSFSPQDKDLGNYSVVFVLYVCCCLKIMSH